MAGITRAERERRAAETSARDEAKYGTEFGGTAYAGLQEQLDATNAIDERLPDRRPATLVDIETQEAAPDNRTFAGDVGKAVNQMVGRAAVTVNHDPHPHITNAAMAPATVNPMGAYEGEGAEIKLLRGYQPDESGPKRLPGEIIRAGKAETKRLVNMRAAELV